MKVNQYSRSRTGPFPSVTTTGNNKTAFADVMSRQEVQLYKKELDKLLVDVQNAGERLGKSRNFQDLAAYKALVKRLVKEAVETGMRVKQSHSWNRFSEGRVLQTVELIDEKLVELTEDVLESEKQSIDILGKIGEIKGLLIHLYT
ncbi:YaaR family protein [Siminovitchia sediminis]|uniref:YaaR family protein n=1 Tax=Siminovitchia sediminis TaxID=1274353 RepID=A0ABW4KPF1_9BACI